MAILEHFLDITVFAQILPHQQIRVYSLSPLYAILVNCVPPSYVGLFGFIFHFSIGIRNPSFKPFGYEFAKYMNNNLNNILSFSNMSSSLELDV